MISRQGSKATAENDTHRMTRNVNFFKRLPGREDGPVVVPEDAETEKNEAARRYPVRRRNGTEPFAPAIYPVE